MYKATVCLTRSDDLTDEEFREYYETSHAPRVDGVPGIRRYTLAFNEADDSPYDSIAELYFDDEAAYERAMSSDRMAELIEDLENFTNTDERLLVAGEENVLIEESATAD
ncbi:MAG: EthD family reductase [Halobacteriales archaeon]|nr:EthD family reductase [Halobacteriales archaeon]